MPNSQVQLTYQVCPIILTGGSAAQIPGGMLPMLSLTNGGSALNLPFDINDLDDAFGAFTVLSGGTLVSQQIAKYTFANQATAANATIREPLSLSVIMDAPMRGPNAWAIKQAVMTALKGTLDAHNNAGGLYTVLTPAFIYDNLVMTGLSDNSRGQNSLPQSAWKFEFEKPLVTLQDAAAAQNQEMSKISNGTPTSGSQSGPSQGTTDANAPGSRDSTPTTTTYYSTPVGTGGPGKPGELGTSTTMTTNNLQPGYPVDAPATVSTQYNEGSGFSSPFTTS